jgi:hypothetical protein
MGFNAARGYPGQGDRRHGRPGQSNGSGKMVCIGEHT